MQNPFKEFLYFSQGERRGILVLITGIILVFLSGYIYIYQREHRPLSDEVIRRQATAMAEYESFIASIQEKEQKWDNRLKPSSQKQPTTVSFARFNPNTADSVIFCRLGLPGWMARFRSTRVPDGYFSGAIRKVTALSLLAGELYNWTVLVSVSFGVMWI